ncbi:MAG: hypothetical protein KAS32_24650 [Candidatus Peribacteraceae bacterium]|nr:hypothetical protein [Candidatus Peribacteraceae bacterium]
MQIDHKDYVKIDDSTFQCIFCGEYGESMVRVVHQEGCQLKEYDTWTVEHTLPEMTTTYSPYDFYRFNE